MDKDQYLVSAILDVPLRVIVVAKLLRWLRARRIEKPVSINAQRLLEARADVAYNIADPYLRENLSWLEEILYKTILQYVIDKRLELDRLRYLGITEIGYIPRPRRNIDRRL
jgi:hypothetical protein